MKTMVRSGSMFLVLAAMILSPSGGTLWARATGQFAVSYSSGDGYVEMTGEGTMTKQNALHYAEIGTSGATRPECDDPDERDYNDDGVVDFPCSRGVYYGGRVGYLEWNITSLPDTAYIFNVWIRYDGWQTDAGKDFKITRLTSQPSSNGTAASTIQSQAYSGTTYVASTNVAAGTQQLFTLGGTVVSDLTGALAANWFAVGLATTATDSDFGRNLIRSVEVSTANPEPTLEVEYSSPTVQPTLSATVYVTSIAWSWNDPNESFGEETSLGLHSSVGHSTAVLLSVDQVSVTETGLTPNTQYSRHVHPYNAAADQITSPVNTTVRTLAAVPTGGSITEMHSSSAALQWNHNSNPVGQTAYIVEATTASGGNFNSFITASSTFTPSVTPATTTLTGLVPNTMTYFRVRAKNNDGVQTDNLTIGNNVTDAAQPSAGSITAIYVSSAALQWSHNSNPVGTEYIVEATTASGGNFSSFITASSTITPAGSPATTVLTGLLPNRLTYFRVRAKNSLGVQSGNVSIGSDYTLAEVPTSGQINAVYASSATLQWSHNGNPTGQTDYVLESSSDPVGGPSGNYSFITSSDVFTPSGSPAVATLERLPSNTTIYFRVRAVNENGFETNNHVIGSTVTMVLPPGVGAFTGIDLTKITANWTSNGNGTGTLYEVYRSARDDSNFSVVEATSPQTTGFSYEFSIDLLSNATYYFRARAFNVNGIPSDYTVLGATMTGVVGVGSDSFNPATDVYKTSATFAWADPGNPRTYSYRVEMSTKASFSGATIYSATVENPTVSAAVTGLTENTTYYARIYTLNGIGAAVPLDSIAPNLNPYPFNGGAGFATRPLAPTSGNFLFVDDYQVHVSWVDANPETTRYDVEVATSTGFETLESSTITTAGVDNFRFNTPQDLKANTTYWARVRARGHSGQHSDYFVIGSTVTKSVVPTVSSFSPVNITSATVNWTASTSNAVNGPSTQYRARVSVNSNMVPVLDSSDTYNLSAGFVSLSTNTTYYFDVTALSNGNSSDLTSAVASTVTLANVPASPAFQGVFQTSATVSWSANTNPNGTQYLVQASSDPSGNFGYISSSSQGTATAQTVTSLSYNTTYFFRVAAVNHRGVNSDFLPIGSTATQTNTPAFAGYTVHATSITVAWSGNGNPSGTLYQAENVGTGQVSGFISGTSWTETGLSTNTTHQYRVLARNFNGVDSSFTLFNTTRTLAVVPPQPDVDINGNNSLEVTFGAGSNPTAAPNRTLFAVKISLSDPDGAPVHTGLYVSSTPTSGNIYPLSGSSSPIWAEMSDWNNGVIIATGLATARDYSFVILARNGDDADVSNGGGVPTAESPADTARTGSGTPVIYLGSITDVQSQTQEVWVNTHIVSFTAKGSYHYHYRINALPNVASPGWDGKIQTGFDLAGDGVNENSPDNTGPVSGFSLPYEGAWQLYLLGDAYPQGPPINSHTASLFYANSPFRVFVDTTPPAVSGLSAQFGPSDPTPITNGQGIADGTPYFLWSAQNNGTPGVISAIVGYTYSFSADPAEVPAMSSGTSNFLTDAFVYVSTPQAYGTYYFKVRALDQAGNWTNPPAEFVYVREPDATAPRVVNVNLGSHVTPLNSRVSFAVGPNASMTITFSEAMHPPSVTASGNISLAAVRTHRGADTSEIVPITVTYDSANFMATVTPANPLRPGYRYELRTNSNVVDLGENPLAEQLAKPFYVLMDPNEVNVLISEDGKTRVRFNRAAWGSNMAGAAINEDPAGAPMAAPALPAIIERANANAFRQLGPYAQPVTLREFNLYDENANRMSGMFSSEVELVLSYPDADNDGVVDNTSPPLREEALSVSWLDEETGVWVRAPGSAVDKVNNTVTVKVRHFSVYGIIGAPALDLANAYAYPVPFKPSLGHREIVFTNLSQVATIRVYTINGELVRELQESDGDGELRWDVTNGDGEPLGSDVFLYVIENNQQRKTGKLLIVR